MYTQDGGNITSQGQLYAGVVHNMAYICNNIAIIIPIIALIAVNIAPHPLIQAYIQPAEIKAEKSVVKIEIMVNLKFIF